MRIFGFWVGPKEPSELAVQCMKTWPTNATLYRAMPNELTAWTQGLKLSPYVQSSITAGNWAAISDLIRLIELFERGGIYLDCDVEIVDLAKLLKLATDAAEHGEVLCGHEYGTAGDIGTAVIAAPPRHPIIYAAIESYAGKIYGKDVFDGKTHPPVLLTRAVSKYPGAVTVLPSDYLYPWGWKEYEKSDPNRRTKVTANTVTAHFWEAGWVE